MQTLKTAITIGWIAFGIYWFTAAFLAKESTHNRSRIPFTGLIALGVVVLVRALGGSMAVHSAVLGVIGTVLFVCGIAVAVWARIHLGRNWGMPMTERAEPELVTSGPYRFVRHPIYSGLLLAVLGTALVTNLIGLVVAVILGGYFCYGASVEEKNLTITFPNAYPAYRGRTKMLVPLVL